MSIDVTLPDGTVVSDVPEGTTRPQLAQRLKAGGYNVPAEWMGDATKAPASDHPVWDYVKNIGGTIASTTAEALRGVPNMAAAVAKTFMSSPSEFQDKGISDDVMRHIAGPRAEETVPAWESPNKEPVESALGTKASNAILTAAEPFKAKMKQVSDETTSWLTPQFRASAQKSAFQGGLKDPDWYVAQLASFVPYVALDLGPAALLARGGYALRAATAAEEALTQQMPQSVARAYVHNEAGRAAQRAAMAWSTTSGATLFGGQVGQGVHDAINELPEDALMNYPEYRAAREAGKSDAVARQEVANNRMLQATLEMGIAAGLAGAPLSKLVAHAATAERLGGTRLAAALRGGVEAGAVGGALGGAQAAISTRESSADQDTVKALKSAGDAAVGNAVIGAMFGAGTAGLAHERIPEPKARDLANARVDDAAAVRKAATDKAQAEADEANKAAKEKAAGEAFTAAHPETPTADELKLTQKDLQDKRAALIDAHRRVQQLEGAVADPNIPVSYNDLERARNDRRSAFDAYLNAAEEAGFVGAGHGEAETTGSDGNRAGRPGAAADGLRGQPERSGEPGARDVLPRGQLRQRPRGPSGGADVERLPAAPESGSGGGRESEESGQPEVGGVLRRQRESGVGVGTAGRDSAEPRDRGSDREVGAGSQAEPVPSEAGREAGGLRRQEDAERRGERRGLEPLPVEEEPLTPGGRLVGVAGKPRIKLKPLAEREAELPRHADILEKELGGPIMPEADRTARLKAGSESESEEQPSAPADNKAIKAELDKPGVNDKQYAANLAEIPRGENLTGEQKRVEGKMAAVVADVPAAERAYAEVPGTEGGRIINTDLARELSPDYNKDDFTRAQHATSVQEPASWLADKLFHRRLAEPKRGKGNVLFTAGGADSGKSVSLKSDVAKAADIVYDGNMNVLSKARRRVKAALDSGRTVDIQATWHDPKNAFRNALKRALKFGRTVPVDAFAATHNGSFKVVTAIAKQYANDPRVNINVIDSTELKPSSLKEIAGKRYDVTPEELRKIAVEEYLNGNITKNILRSVGGERAVRLAESGKDNGRLPAERVGGRSRKAVPGGAALEGARRYSRREESRGARAQEQAGLGEGAPGEVHRDPVEGGELRHTAFVSGELGARSAEENAYRTQRIEERLRGLGLDVTPAEGRYTYEGGGTSEEKSFMVRLRGAEDEQAVKDVGKEFGQESIAVVRDADTALHYGSGKTEDLGVMRFASKEEAEKQSAYTRLADDRYLITEPRKTPRGDAGMWHGNPDEIAFATADDKAVIRNGGIDEPTQTAVRDQLQREYGVNVNFVNHPSEVPGIDQWAAQNLPISGVFSDDVDGGQIHLIAGNLGSHEHALRTADHEIVGHYGLSGMLGGRRSERYERVMSRIAASFPKLTRDMAARNNIGINDPAVGPRIREIRVMRAAEEIVAYAAERSVRAGSRSVWSRLASIVRDGLRQAGLLWRYTENDIASLIDRAAEWVRRGGARRAQIRDEVAIGITGRPREYSFDIVKLADVKEQRRQKEFKDALDKQWEGELARRDKVIQRLRNQGHYRYEVGDRLRAPNGGIVKILTQNEFHGEPIYFAEFTHTDGRVTQGGLTQARMSGNWELFAGPRSEAYATTAPKTTEMAAFLAKINPKERDQRTLKERLRDWRHAAEQGIFEEFHGIERAFKEGGGTGPNIGLMKAQLSRNADQLLASVIRDGIPVWRNDEVGLNTDRGGYQDILAPLGNKLDDWIAARVARRAARLYEEGRERNFSPEEIKAGNELWKQHPEFERAYAERARFASAVLDFAQGAGIINPETRPTWENADHIPFKRISEDIFGGAGGGIGRVKQQIHRLKGGAAPLADPLQSEIENWGSLLKASLRNKAMTRVIDDMRHMVTRSGQPMIEAGKAPTDIKITPEEFKQRMLDTGIDPANLDAHTFQHLYSQLHGVPEDPNTIWHWVDGQKVYWKVNDATLYQSLINLSHGGESDFLRVWQKFVGAPARVLRRAIVNSPVFAAKIFARHTQYLWVLGRYGSKSIPPEFVPLVDSVKGFWSIMRNTEEAKQLRAAGGIFSDARAYGEPVNATRHLRWRLGAKSVPGTVLSTLTDVADFYHRFLNAAEGSNRIAIANSAAKAGASRTEQAFAARKVLDYTAHGQSLAIKMLATAVPFTTGHLSGLHGLMKQAAQNPAGVALRGAVLALGAVMYAYYNHGNPRYQALTDDQKANYFHFYDVFTPGDHWQLPKSFEDGDVFVTIPEALTDMALSNQVDRVRTSVGVMTNATEKAFGYDWCPTEVRPILDLAENRQSYSGAPILTQRDLEVVPQAQDAPYVSPTIRAIAQHTPDFAPDFMKSPKQMQYLASGYFGTVGQYVLAMTDVLARGATGETRPAGPGFVEELPSVNQIYASGPARRTRYTDSMYTVAKQIAEDYQTLQKDIKTGDNARVRADVDKYRDYLKVRGAYDTATKEVAEIRKAILLTQQDKAMTPEAKQERINTLQQRINDIAEAVYRVRPGGPLSAVGGKLIGATLPQRVTILRQSGLPATSALLQSSAQELAA